MLEKHLEVGYRFLVLSCLHGAYPPYQVCFQIGRPHLNSLGQVTNGMVEFTQLKVGASSELMDAHP